MKTNENAGMRLILYLLVVAFLVAFGRGHAQIPYTAYGEQGNVSVIQCEGQQGLINNGEEVLLEPRFDFISLFEYGIARITKDGKWGLTDDTGKVLQAPQFDYISLFETNYENGNIPLAFYLLNGKCGILNVQGDIVKPAIYACHPAYILFGYYYNNVLVLEKDDLWGAIRSDGSEIIAFTYPSAEKAIAELDPETRKHYEWMDIDTSDDLVEEPIMQPIQNDGRWGCGIGGKITVPCIFDFVTKSEDGTFIAFTVNSASDRATPMYALGTTLRSDSIDEAVSLLSETYRSTSWYRIDDSGVIHGVKKSDTNIFPFFRQGVAVHEVEVSSAEGIFVVYMNPYGEVLRILKNNEYPSQDPGDCPLFFDAWDLWDTYQIPVNNVGMDD